MENNLLSVLKSLEDAVKYLSSTHADQLRKDVYDLLRLYTDTLPVQERATIYSRLTK